MILHLPSFFLGAGTAVVAILAVCGAFIAVLWSVPGF